MKLNFYLKQLQLPKVSLFLILSLIALSPLKLAALFAVILIGGYVVSKYIKGIGAISTTLISFLLLTCLQQALGILFWLLHVPFVLEWYILIILFCQLAYLIRINEPLQLKSFLQFNRLDIVSVIIATLSIGVLAFGILRTGPADVQMTRFITRGFDSSTHLSLIMSVYDNRGYVYGPLNEVHDRLVFTSLTSYPQGWHLVTSSMWTAIDDDLSFENTAKLLAFFFATTLFWYFLLIFFASRVVAEVANRLSKERMPFSYLLLCLATTSFLLQASTALGLIRYGFVNYIALITYLLCTVLLVLFVYKKETSMRSFIITGTLLSTGAAFTWLLAAPIGYSLVAIGAVLSKNGKTMNIRTYVSMWKTYLPTTLIVSILLLATLIQIYLQVHFSTIPNNIAADTVIWSTNRLLITILLFSLLAFVLHNKRDTFLDPTKNALFAATFGSLLVPGLIYFYLFFSSGKIGYYSEKINTVPTIVLICLAGGIGAGVLWNLRKNIGTYMVYMVVVLITVSAPLSLGVDLKELKFAAGKDWTTSGITARQINHTLEDKTGNRNNVFILKEKNYEEDVISTHFMNVISRKETKCSSSIGWNQMIRSTDILIKEIRRCTGANPNIMYKLIVSKSNQQFWQNKITGIENIRILVED